jgi:adenosylcobinamide-GDP ribazoletransferase
MTDETGKRVVDPPGGGLFYATAFLTRLPIRKLSSSTADLAHAAAWFPFVGLLLGGLLAAFHFLLVTIFPAWLAAPLMTAVWAGLTGFMHLDGLADCFDGLFAPVSRERRLEILHDPRIGSFGAAGLFLFLLIKTGAITALGWQAYRALLLAPALARWWVLVAARAPQAYPGGMGDRMAAAVKPATLLTAAIVPALISALCGLAALPAVIFSGLVAGLILHTAKNKLGGVTGDVMGLTVECTEAAVLLVFAMLAGLS